jgi:hypothetical protein
MKRGTSSVTCHKTVGVSEDLSDISQVTSKTREGAVLLHIAELIMFQTI